MSSPVSPNRIAPAPIAMSRGSRAIQSSKLDANDVGHSRTWQIPVALFLLAILPRLILAYRVDVYCSDGYHFLAQAQRIETVGASCAFGNEQFNLYPLLLAGLHLLGFSWNAAAQGWSIVAASLAVLPLYSLVRRMFDQPIALVTAVLYAVHPNLIESSVEPLRDPTFWLMFLLTLDVAHRAAFTVSLSWFLPATFLFCAAVALRVEGGLLALPIAGWWWQRFAGRPSDRWRLVSVLLLSPALLLTAVLGATYGVTRGAQLQTGRVADYAVYVRNKTTHLLFGENNSELSDPKAVAVAPLHRLNRFRDNAARVYRLTHRAIRSWELHFTLLLILGVAVAKRRFQSVDYWPLHAVAATLCFVAFINIDPRFDREDGLNSRHLFLVLFVYLPFVAVGLIRIAAWCAASNHRIVHVLAGKAHPLLRLMALLAIVGVVDAATLKLNERRYWADVGHWLHQNVAASEIVIDGVPEQVGYFGAPKFDPNNPPGDVKQLFNVLNSNGPGAIVISRGLLTKPGYDEWLGAAHCSDYQELQHPFMARVLVLEAPEKFRR